MHTRAARPAFAASPGTARGVRALAPTPPCWRRTVASATSGRYALRLCRVWGGAVETVYLWNPFGGLGVLNATLGGRLRPRPHDAIVLNFGARTRRPAAWPNGAASASAPPHAAS